MLTMGNSFNPNALSLFSNNMLVGQPSVSVNSLVPLSLNSSTTLFPNTSLQNTSIGMPQFSIGIPQTSQFSSTQIPQVPMLGTQSQGSGINGLASQLQSAGSMMMQCASMLQSLLGNCLAPQQQSYAQPAYPYPQQQGYMPATSYSTPVSYLPQQPTSYMPPISYNPPVNYAPQQSGYFPTSSYNMPVMNPLSYMPPEISNPLSQIPQMPQTPQLSQTPIMPSYFPPAANIPPYYTDDSTSSSSEDQDPTSGYDAPTYDGGNNGNYHGDPHLVGFDGETYDVMGQPGKIYNMLSDKGLQYNTKFDSWGNKGNTIISEAGIQVGKSQVRFDRSGKAPTIDGKDMEVGKTVQLDEGGSATWDGSKLTVKTKEYTIHLDVKDDNNGFGPYLNSQVSINEDGPFSDFVAPHGLLGQTADGVKGKKDSGKDQGKQGGTVIDGTVDDYEVKDLWADDDKFNRFDVQIGQVIENPEDGSIAKVLDTDGNVIFEMPKAESADTGSAA